MSAPKPGKYVELTPDLLDEGEFQRRLTEEMRRMYEELERYEQISGKTDGKVKLSANIQLSRGGKEYFEIEYGFDLKAPKAKHETMARGAGGRLLIDPEGDSLNDKDQARLTFDRFGNEAAVVNPMTGEVEPVGDEEKPTAGRIPSENTA